MSSNELDPAVLEPREFSRRVKNTPVDDLRALMLGERRKPILDELLRRMPDRLRADRARSVEATVHWNIGDRSDGGVDVYELIISGGRCTLSAVPGRAPELTLTLGAVDFLHLVTGNAHPVMLVMRGRLSTEGDLRLTARFPNLFDIPRP